MAEAEELAGDEGDAVDEKEFRGQAEERLHVVDDLLTEQPAEDQSGDSDKSRPRAAEKKIAGDRHCDQRDKEEDDFCKILVSEFVSDAGEALKHGEGKPK